MSDDIIKHVGTKRHSGRYPWGSGDEAYQHTSFLAEYETLRKRGLSQTEIASELGMNTTQLRNNITWAGNAKKQLMAEQVKKSIELGMSNVAIGKEQGISEGTVRNIRKQLNDTHQVNQEKNVRDAIIKGVENTGYLDVGVGVELQVQVPRTRFNKIVDKLVLEDGYYVHNIRVKNQNAKEKPITVKVLTKDPDSRNTYMNSEKVRPLDSWSDDRGETISNINPPKPFDINKLKIRYQEEGGEAKDGVIEMRPGVDDLDMGSNHYAQVRIQVGDSKYMKGMAVYGNPKDFPDGIDIIYNSKKPLGTSKEDALKNLKEETDNVFGSTISYQNKSNTLNYVNQEGEWDTWSTDLSSQFLSKQPSKLIKDRLDATHAGLKAELDELSGLTNPVVKQFLIDKYSLSLETRARKLNAKGITGTKSHVILPFPDMNPDEIYAPNYQNGDRVVLVRYPHGGVFELPEVTVNNKNPKAREVMGIAKDAIGIHPSVAKKLSGADFDGDTVWVIPNNDPSRKIKTSRALKELKNFDPMDYKLPKDPNKKKAVTPEEKRLEQKEDKRKEKVKQMEMGKVSNLITDMTIKGAPESDIAAAVRHSMVVIDSVKHNLDYKQSAIDNGISALKSKWQLHINPDTNKKSVGASTLISRSKRLVDDLHKKDKEPEDLGYNPKARTQKKKDIGDLSYNPEKYSSGTDQERLYVDYIKQLKVLKNRADKTSMSTTMPKYRPEAAKVYASEVKSIKAKLDIAKLNAPRERQARILSNKLFFSNYTKDMDKDQIKKLKNRSLARARDTVGARGKEATIKITPSEWKAIQAYAISTNSVKEILKYSDMDLIRSYATPRQATLTSSKVGRAKAMLSNGKTYAEIAQALGVSVATIKKEVDGN